MPGVTGSRARTGGWELGAQWVAAVSALGFSESEIAAELRVARHSVR
jgi:hypothetical protein